MAERPEPEQRQSDGTLEVSVVVPTFREAGNIGELLERLGRVRSVGGLDLELVIVDDSSDDGTAEQARSAGLAWVRVLERTGVRDLSQSVMLGVDSARAAVIVVMDADLSHAPEDVPRLVEALGAGAEFVVGSRYVAGGSTGAQWGVVRKVVSRVAAGIARPLCPARDPLSGFLCFRKSLMEQASGLTPSGYKIGLELMVRSGLGRVEEVPIRFEDRRKGRSKLGARQVWQFLAQLGRLTMVGPSGNRTWIVCAAALIALVLVVFGKAVGHDLLNWDDRFHVAENAILVADWPVRLTRFWQEPHGNLYVPVFYNFMALVGAVSGAGMRGLEIVPPDARALHGVQIALHAINVLLVFWLIRCVLGRSRRAAFGALIGGAVFALHPLQVEAVAWISETRGTLAMCMALVGARLCIAAGKLWRRPDCGWFRASALDGAGLVCFALGMLSKPSVAAMALIVVVLGRWAMGWSLKRTLSIAGIWGSAAAAGLAVTRIVQEAGEVAHGVPIGQRWIVALDALGFYAWKLLWPFGLAADYGRTPRWVVERWPSDALWVVGLAVVGATVWLGGRVIRGAAERGAAWHWGIGLMIFVASLAPALGLSQFHHQNISTVADRYAHVALFGVAMGIAGMLSCARSALLWVAAIAVVAGLALRSSNQLAHWKDDVALWRRAVEVNPSSALAVNNLGYALYERIGKAPGVGEEALAQLLRAEGLEPGLSITLTNLSLTYYAMGDVKQAEEVGRRAVEAPLPAARAFGALGMALLAQGRYQDSLVWLEYALQHQPLDVEMRNNFGLSLAALGRHAEAIEQYRFALRVRPEFVPVMFNMAGSLCAIGAWDDAAKLLERVVELAPEIEGARETLREAQRNVTNRDKAE